MTKTKRITIYGLLIALALVLSFLESQIPAFFAVPGMKLGITNVVVVVALYKLNWYDAIFINIIRIILVALMFSNAASFLYSLAGGVLSCFIMIILKEIFDFSLITVSIAGGVFHNVGQILMAIILLATPAIGYYMVILWFTGIITGLIIGIISAEIIKRLPKIKD